MLPAGPASAATSVLQQLAPLNAIHPTAALGFSVPGDITGPARFVDMQIPAAPAPGTSTSGCEAADFAGFPANAIAVIQRGTCSFAIKAANAQAAGAFAVVIFNEGQLSRTDVVAGPSVGPGVTIPVVGTSFAVAQQLFTQGGVILRVTATASGCDAPPLPARPSGAKTSSSPNRAWSPWAQRGPTSSTAPAAPTASPASAATT